MENQFVDQSKSVGQELDLMSLIVRIFQKRRFIIRVISLFILLGFVVSLTTPVEYSAKCVVVPETKSGAFSNSSMGGLAALAGINLGSSSGGEMLSPSMYNSLLNNVNLCKELIMTPINISGCDTTVTIIDYFTKKEFQKFSLKSAIRKYTIGLPSVIFGLFKKTSVQDVVENNIGEPYNLSAFTNREQIATNAIIKKININTGGKGGSVEISATMPDPVAAAQVVIAVKDLLQKYVIELKLQKAEINYNFIQQRYDEAKQVFEVKQEAYAKYQDANKSLSTALSRAKGEQIKNEYDVASSLFNQLTTQLVQAEMKVKEDIPILTVVEPVTVPLYKSTPNTSMILVAFVFLGCVFGCALVFCIDWLFSLGFESKFMKKIFV